MKKAGKFAVAALVAVLAVSAACFAFAACGESAPELTDTYQSQARLKYFTCAEVTLTGSTSTHMFDAGQMVFEYKSPMFVTLLGLEIY